MSLQKLQGYKVISLTLLTNFLHPWRCLCRGFLQMTRTTFLRFTILQDSQSLLTDGRTFIFHENEKRRRSFRAFICGET